MREEIAELMARAMQLNLTAFGLGKLVAEGTACLTRLDEEGLREGLANATSSEELVSMSMAFRNRERLKPLSMLYPTQRKCTRIRQGTPATHSNHIAIT